MLRLNFKEASLISRWEYSWERVKDEKICPWSINPTLDRDVTKFRKPFCCFGKHFAVVCTIKKKSRRMKIKSGIINFVSRNMNLWRSIGKKSTYFCQQEEAVEVNRGSNLLFRCLCDANKGWGTSVYGNLLIFQANKNTLNQKINSIMISSSLFPFFVSHQIT